MKQDITFEKNNMIFNYRVAIVIKNNNFVLIQKDDRVSHITLPGGRCELGETTKETAIREFEEETNIKCKFKKDLEIIENFFVSSFNQKKYHEILFVLELEFVDKNNYKLKEIKNVEEKKKDHLKYIWIDIKNLKKSNFKPEIIINSINNNKFKHEINN